MFKLFRKNEQNGNEQLIWPKDEDNNDEKAVFLCHLSSNDMQDELKINMLEAYGIPVVKKYPGDGEFAKVIMGMSGNGADLFVPESLFEDAIELCKEENEDNEQLS